MKLIAKKPCSFGGERFYIGDEIPAEFVMDPKAQEKMGVLVQVDAQEHPAPVPCQEKQERDTVNIRIPVEEGELVLEVTVQGLQEVFAIMTAKTADAEPVIEQMTDGDALILLHLADSRKSIKAAAETRAKALSTNEEEPEEVGEQ